MKYPKTLEETALLTFSEFLLSFALNLNLKVSSNLSSNKLLLITLFTFLLNISSLE